MAGTRWAHLVSRFQSMGRDEFLFRSRQEFSKRWDTLLYRAGIDPAPDLGKLSKPGTGRFFFAAEDVEGLVELLRQRLPSQAAQIVSQAEKICNHLFDLLGYKDLDFGDPIDWHLDAVHGKRAPRKPFYKVRYLDFQEVGDSKITWELNRHQHLVTLAKAFRLTGERKYADEIFQQWKHWHAENPYPIGINWASSLEVGFRSISWSWVVHLLKSSSVLPPGFQKEWLRAQALNGRHIERYLSTYFSPNTHLLGEAVALFFLGTLCSELSSAARWKTLGWKIILQEARRQVNPDGLHFEQSTYYHVYALDLFLHAIALATANGQSIPKELEQVIEKMLNALYALGAAGPPPTFGDDDGGRVFDASRNRAEHLLDPLSTGAVLFNRGDLKGLAGELREETIWLLGLAGVEEWDRIEAKPPAPVSAAMRTSGVYVLATDSAQLAIDAGSSVAQSHGHDHADALSVCLHSGGRALLIDPGTYEYVGERSERDRYRGTAMHNTLQVDGQDQAEPAGPFKWKQHFRTRTEQCILGGSFDLLVASHDGYGRLPSPVVHRRWVVALKAGIILLRDLAEGEGEHRLDIAWHLAPDLHVQGEHQFGFKNSQQGLAILPVQGHGWAHEVHKGQCAPAYGQQSPATILSFGASITLPTEFVTLLVPIEEASRALGTLVRLQDPDATEFVRAYRYEAQGSEYRFYFARPEQPWKSGPVSSDAEFLCLSSRPGSEKPQIAFCNGSYVEIAGGPVLRAERRVSRCEFAGGNAGSVSCSDPEAVIVEAADAN
jgi:hypothetical protein